MEENEFKERTQRTTAIKWTLSPHRHQERTTMADKHHLHTETKHRRRQENKIQPIANKQNPTEHHDMMTHSRKWGANRNRRAQDGANHPSRSGRSNATWPHPRPNNTRGKQNRNRQPLKERRETGNRARILRIATFNYLAHSQVRNTTEKHQSQNKKNNPPNQSTNMVIRKPNISQTPQITHKRITSCNKHEPCT